MNKQMEATGGPILEAIDRQARPTLEVERSGDL